MGRLTKHWIDRLVFGFTSLFDDAGDEFPKRAGVQFTGLSIVDDEANDRLIVGPAFPVVQEDLTLPLLLDKDRTILIEESTARLVISPAPEGHKDGAQKVIIIEAEAIEELVLSGAFVVRGDFTVTDDGTPVGWDSTKKTVLAFSAVGNAILCATFQYEPVEAGVPVVVSATVFGANPQYLVVEFDSPADHLGSIVGLSLSTGAGVSIIEAIPTDNGTSTLTFGLSAPLNGDETFDLVISSARVVQSIYGPRVATGTTAVSLEFGPSDVVTGATHLWRNDSRTTSGADVLTLIDQIGNADLTVGATEPTTTTLGSLAGAAMQMAAGSYLTTGDIAAETMTSGSINIIFRVVTGGDRGLVTGGNGTTFEALSYVAGGGGTLLGASNQAQTGGLSQAWTPGTTIHSVCLTWDPSGREQYLDNVLHDSDTADAATPNITKWVVGALLDLTTLSGGTIIVGEIQIGNTHLANGAEIHAIRASRYGT